MKQARIAMYLALVTLAGSIGCAAAAPRTYVFASSSDQRFCQVRRVFTGFSAPYGVERSRHATLQEACAAADAARGLKEGTWSCLSYSPRTYARCEAVHPLRRSILVAPLASAIPVSDGKRQQLLLGWPSMKQQIRLLAINQGTAQYGGDVQTDDRDAYPNVAVVLSEPAGSHLPPNPVPSCTITRVGDGVWLTAAHCVLDAADYFIGSSKEQAPIGMTCEPMPTYTKSCTDRQGDCGRDVAVCVATSPCGPQCGVKPGDLAETIQTTPWTASGNAVFVSHMCQASPRTFNPVVVSGIAPDPPIKVTSPTDPAFKTCGGDSGGALIDKATSGRRMIGMVLQDDVPPIDGVGLWDTKVVEFLKGWAQGHANTMCGISASHAGCR